MNDLTASLDRDKKTSKAAGTGPFLAENAATE